MFSKTGTVSNTRSFFISLITQLIKNLEKKKPIMTIFLDGPVLLVHATLKLQQQNYWTDHLFVKLQHWKKNPGHSGVC